MSNLNQITLHHTRGEIQGTVQLLFAENAATLAAANAAGYLDYGNFLGAEIKADPKREPTLSAYRGVVIQSSSTAGQILLGMELTTKEVADARKVRHLLSAKETTDLVQAVINAAAVDTLVFTADVPAVLNRWYPILKDGVQVREISAVAFAIGAEALVEGEDYIVDKKLGLVRFIDEDNLPEANVTPTVTAPAIDADHVAAMKGFLPMTKSVWRGFARILEWDQDDRNNLVKDYEPREVEITLSGGSTLAHDKQSEMKLMVTFTSNTRRVLARD